MAVQLSFGIGPEAARSSSNQGNYRGKNDSDCAAARKLPDKRDNQRKLISRKTWNVKRETWNLLGVLDVQIGKGGEAESDDVVATGELPGSVQGTLQ